MTGIAGRNPLGNLLDQGLGVAGSPASGDPREACAGRGRNGRAGPVRLAKFCEPGPALLRNLLAAIEDISNARPGDWDEARVHIRWTSTRFLWPIGFTRHKALMLPIARDGSIPRLRARFHPGSWLGTASGVH